jgi:hypothetical protein
MAGNVNTLAPGAQDATQSPAAAKISPNVRALAATGPISTVADVLVFPGAPPAFTVVGNWLVPNTRVLVGGIPTIGQTSVGNAFSAVGVPTGPVTVKITDPRVMAQ